MKFLLASFVAGISAVNVETQAHTEVHPHPHHRHHHISKSKSGKANIQSNMTAAKMHLISALQEQYPDSIIMLPRQLDEQRYVDAWEQYQSNHADMQSALSALFVDTASDDIDKLREGVKQHCDSMVKVVAGDKKIDSASLTKHWSDFAKNWGLDALANNLDALVTVNDATIAITSSCVGYEENTAHCCNALQAFCCEATRSYQALAPVDKIDKKDYVCPKDCAGPGIKGQNQVPIPQ